MQSGDLGMVGTEAGQRQVTGLHPDTPTLLIARYLNL